MPPLTPIPLTRLQPATKRPEIKQPNTITVQAAQIGKVKESTPPSAAPEGPSPAQLMEEFDHLRLKLNRHQSGDTEMPADEYKTALRRALELVSQMNQTTAGPKAKGTKKIGVEKQAPKSLMDL